VLYLVEIAPSRGAPMYPPVSHTTDLVAALFYDEPCRAEARAKAVPERRRRTLRERLLGR
jgi:hypothetical protein